MARWMEFRKVDGGVITLDVESIDGVEPCSDSKGRDAIRLWFGCPKDDVTPGADIYGSLLVEGEYGRLMLMLGTEMFT